MLKENSVVNTVGGAGEIKKLIFSDINPCSEVEDKGSFQIEYPYEITITDEKKKVILKEKSQGILRAKNWTKKFYLKETDKGEYVAFSRYLSLLALVTIAKKQKGDLPAQLDLNTFVGFEFEGNTIELDSGDVFIDWVGTFAHNGIEVPSAEELGGSSGGSGKTDDDVMETW